LRIMSVDRDRRRPVQRAGSHVDLAAQARMERHRDRIMTASTEEYVRHLAMRVGPTGRSHIGSNGLAHQLMYEGKTSALFAQHGCLDAEIEMIQYGDRREVGGRSDEIDVDGHADHRSRTQAGARTAKWC